MDGVKDNATKHKIKSQEKNKNINGKIDTFDLTAGITDVKKLGSENLKSQVFYIICVIKLQFYLSIKLLYF